MNFIYLIKTINILALVFIPTSYIFTILGYINDTGVLYIWLCGIEFLIGYLNRKKSKLVIILYILIFIPLFTAKSPVDIVCICFYALFVLYIEIKSVHKLNHSSELGMFKNGIFIVVAVFVISFAGGMNIFTRYSAKYILLYLVSSIIFLRNLRLYEFNMDREKGIKLNLLSSAFLIFMAFILSLESIRIALFEIIKKAYMLFVNGFLNLFSWAIIFIGNIVGNFITSAIIFIRKLLGYTPTKISEGVKLPNKKYEEYDALVNKLINNQYFILAIKIIIVVIIALIFIKIFKSLFNISKHNVEYTEEKEYIKNNEKVDGNHKKSLFDFLIPKTNSQRIRLFYQKYMTKCINRDIDIKEFDTTEDINGKAKNKFDEGIISKFRNIYIRVRYGEVEVEKDSVKEMETYYKKINSK